MQAPIGAWQTVVNNGDTVPTTSRNFNSYNQPSINDAGLVVFRARSSRQGGEGPATGIFTRDMSTSGNPIVPVAMRGGEVPAPNTVTSPGPATFNEFPSFPRIDANSGTLAFRGQSTPSVLTILPDGNIITFKGNWTDSEGVAQTGVYFRDMVADSGTSPVVKLAERGDAIPTEAVPGGGSAVFGSTAPPRRP